MNANVMIEQVNFEALDDIYRGICEIFTSIKSKKDISIDELVELYSKDNNFSDDLNIIGNSLTEIADILEPIEVLEDEYYYFLSIRRMIMYILNEIKLFLRHIFFIDDLLINFFNLIHQKSASDEKNYLNYFSTSITNLERQKNFFYNNIFEFSDEYDDLIVDVTNILW